MKNLSVTCVLHQLELTLITMLSILMSLVVAHAHAQHLVPPGSQRVPMLSFVLTADCAQDAVIYGIDLRHRGLGALEDISGVYAMVGPQRISTVRLFASRDGRISIPIRDLIIPACSALPITIAADFAPTASLAGEHGFILDGPQAIDTNGQVRTEVNPLPAPIRSSGEVTPSLTVRYVNLSRRITVGRNQTVAKLRLEGDPHHHQYISSIMLTNDGSANWGDLRNLQIVDSRLQPLTGMVPRLNGRTVYLEFNPHLVLLRNERKTIQLKADIYGGVRRTIRFIIEEPGDIQATRLRARR